mmetsp:Transcript_15459/g.31940  ORF Transcript_15459/g.31940 Transcript_15459/m.31940 type:complete len:96 (+) Transcript_15459:2167-2454(+)
MNNTIPMLSTQQQQFHSHADICSCGAHQRRKAERRSGYREGSMIPGLHVCGSPYLFPRLLSESSSPQPPSGSRKRMTDASIGSCVTRFLDHLISK